LKEGLFMGYCHKTFLVRGLLLIVLMLGSTDVALAQDIPILQPSFEPIPPADPNPCFEFACFNRAVLDGDTLAVIGAEYPAIYVYVRQGSSWSFQATLTNSLSTGPVEPYPSPYAYPLALHGDELFVTWTGTEVHVFRRLQSPSGAQWNQQQIITLTTADGLHSLSPIGIAVDGDRAAISTGDTVQVFRRGADHQYRIEARLSPDSTDSPFGASIALQRAVIAVGAPTDNASAGAVYIFSKAKDRWVLVHKLESPLDSEPAEFGTVVALDRLSLAICTPLAVDASTGHRGLVYVYSLAGLQHRQPQVVTDPYEPSDATRNFGTTVDIQGPRLLVGSSNAYPWAQDPGAYLFERDRQVWQPVAELTSYQPLGVQLSRSIALVDSKGFHFGSFPGIYNLPPLDNADTTSDVDTALEAE
jgi:hypothetical protein